MYVYHGTSKGSLKEFEQMGYVPEGTYWGGQNLAIQYAESFGKDAVVLRTKLHGRCAFKANMALANQYYHDGELDVLPDEDDVDFSMREYESVVAGEAVFDYEVFDLK